ncbi:MAG: autotransporter-associated beta strand repeat-containing protein, partial [Bacillota bacterium]
MYNFIPTVYTVSQATDDGTGGTEHTLSWAINHSNSNDGVDSISFTVPAVTLSNVAAPTGADFLPVITDSVDMNVGGTAVTVQVTDQTSDNYRVFNIGNGGTTTVTIENMTIKGGDISAANESGGGIYVDNGSSLDLNNCFVSGSRAYDGGGIYVNFNGTLNATGSTIDQCHATDFGGGLATVSGAAKVSLVQCTFSNNILEAQDGFGGGIWLGGSIGPTVNIANCSIINNTVPSGGFGGGLANDNGGTNVTMTNCTVSGNSLGYGAMPAKGAGIYNADANTLTITSSTVSGNGLSNAGGTTYGGGVYSASNDALNMENCIISTNTASAGSGIYNTTGLLKPGSLKITSSTAASTISDGIFNDTTAFSVTGAGNTEISGVISGATGITKSGSGVLTLSGVNTYTGVSTISGGTVSIATLGNGGVAGNLGQATNAVGNIVLDGGILSYTGATASTDRGITVNSTGGTLNVTTSGNTLTIGTTGIADAGALSIGGAGNTTISSVLSGAGSLVKNDAGRLTLSGTNTYTGVSTISGGTVSIATLGNGGVAGNLGQATNAVGNIVLDGGILSYTGATASTDRGITVNSTGGTLNVTTSGNTLTIGTTGIANAGALLVGGAGNTTISSVISGSGGLTKSGAGTLTLSGVNTYTGATTISGGTVTISADSGLGAAPSSATAGQLTFDGGTLETTADFTLNSNRGILLNSSGGVISTDAGTALTYGGIITGSGALTKQGTGNFITNGGAITSGGLTVAGGTFNSGLAAGSWDINGNVAIASGATLDATSGIMTVSGDWTNAAGGTFTANGGTVTFDGAAASVSTISGLNTFNNFTCSTAGKILNFATGLTSSQIINGSFTLTGADGNLITVKSANPGTAATIKVTTPNVSYVTVSDSDNSTGTLINPTSSTNGGNTTNWFGVSGFSIGGTIWGGDPALLHLYLNGVDTTKTATITSGNYSFTGLTDTGYYLVDYSTGTAGYVAYFGSAASRADLNINSNSLVNAETSLATMRSALGVATTAANLFPYYQDGVTNNIIVKTGISFGGIGAFALDGNLTTQNANMTFNGATTAVTAIQLAAGSGNITATNPGNNFGSITFTGAAVSLTDSDGFSLAGTNTASGIANLTAMTGAINGSGGYSNTTAATTINGGLNLTGIVNISGQTLTVVAGSNDVTATNAANNFGTVAVTSGKDVSLVDVNALTLGTSTVSGVMTITAGGTLTVSGPLTIGAGNATLTTSAASNSDIILAGAVNKAGSTADATLSLQSDRNIILNDGASINATPAAGSNKLNILLNSRVNDDATGYISLQGDNTLNSNGGNISLTGGSSGTDFAVGDATQGNGIVISRNQGAPLTIPVTISAGAGNILLKGKGATVSTDVIDWSKGIGIYDVNMNTTTGSITLYGTGGTLSGGSANLSRGINFVGIVNVNTYPIAITTTSGAITLNGTGGTSAGNGNEGIYFEDTGRNFSITSTSGAIAINAAKGSGASAGLKIDQKTTIGGTTNNVELNLDKLQFTSTANNQISGTGSLSIKPLTAGTTVSIGGSSTLNLPTTLFNGAVIKDGFSNVTIGDGTNTGALTIGGAVTFVDPTVLQTASGNIAVNSALATGSNNLTLTSGGAVTQTGAITAAGATVITAGGSDANVTLDNTSNDFGGVVSVSNAKNISLRDLNALALGNLVTLNNGILTLQAGGAITQSAGTAITVNGTGTTTVTCVSTSDVTLANAGNDFGSAVAVSNVKNISLRDTNAMALGNLTTLNNGGVTLQAGGDITQAAGTAIVTNGTGTTSITTAGNAVTLANTGNNFAGAVAVDTTADSHPAGANITINDINNITTGDIKGNNLTITAPAGAITLGSGKTLTGNIVSLTQNLQFNLDGGIAAHSLDLSVTRAGRAITQSSPLTTITGNCSFTTNGGAITLTSANDFTGAVSLNSANGTAAGANVSLTDINGLSLGTVNTGTSGTATFSAGGALTQTGIITAGGTTVVTAGGATADVTLANSGNDFGSVIAVSNVRNISLRDTNALVLGNLATLNNGGVILQAGGDITQASDTAITAYDTTITTSGNAVTLANTGNNFGGAVGVDTTADTHPSGANITLYGSSSISTGDIKGNDVTITAGNAIALGIGKTITANNVNLTASRLLSSVRSDSFAANSLSILLTGAGNAITQSSKLTTITGNCSFTTNGGLITLNQATNDFTGSVSLNSANGTAAGAAVSLTDINGLVLGTVNTGTGGAATFSAGGALTQTGIVTAGGATTITAGGVITLDNVANDFNSLRFVHGGVGVVDDDVTIKDKNALTITGANSGRTINVIAVGNMTIATGASITSAATGDALKLATSGNFINNSVVTAPLTAASGRWLVYSTNPAADTPAGSGLRYDFKQYNATPGTAVSGTGNGVLYSMTAPLSFTVGGSTTKEYDGTTTVINPQTLSAVYSSGQIGNDQISAGAVSSATYDNKNAGSGKTVTLLGVTVTANQPISWGTTVPVYGYTVNPGSTGTVGEITTKALTITPNSGQTGVYNGTVMPTTAITYANSALATGDSTFSGVLNTASKNVGDRAINQGTLVVDDGNSGNNYAYTIASQTYAITARAITASGEVATNKVYDRSTTAALTGTTSLTGVISGDT